MDVLILGGTGVISTGITRLLADSRHDVTCFTRGESEARVPEAVEFVHGDRNDRTDLERALATDPDCVIDMICFTPEQAETAIEVFGGAIDQYIFCSTVDVYYRPPARNPVREGAQRHDDEHYVSDYGRDKTRAEDAFMAAHKDGAFATTIIRPWSTYGEGGTVFHTFGGDTTYLHRLREGKPIVVHGDGTSIWASCHRDDVARAFVNAVGTETAYGEAYDVTSAEHITWNQYHRTVASAMDAPDPELVHIPTNVLTEAVPAHTDMLEAHFQYSTTFDTTKAERDLDFTYSIDFETGVRRTVEWLEERDRIEPTREDPFEDALIDAWRNATTDVVSAMGRDD